MEATISFLEHKEQTAQDVEGVAKLLNNLAAEIREGNMEAFESWWDVGGTEEGDATVFKIREMLMMRYIYRLNKRSNQCCY